MDSVNDKTTTINTEPAPLSDQHQRYIMAIDPGFVPLTYCVYDLWTQTVVKWGFYLCRNRSANAMVDEMKHFITTHQSTFDQCFAIVIEIQMRAALKCQITALHALLYEKSMLIAPLAVKHGLRIQLDDSTWAQNKQHAIDFIRTHYRSVYYQMERYFIRECLPHLPKKTQKYKHQPHDAADTFLMCLYYDRVVYRPRVELRDFLRRCLQYKPDIDDNTNEITVE